MSHTHQSQPQPQEIPQPQQPHKINHHCQHKKSVIIIDKCCRYCTATQLLNQPNGRKSHTNEFERVEDQLVGLIISDILCNEHSARNGWGRENIVKKKLIYIENGGELCTLTTFVIEVYGASECKQTMQHVKLVLYADIQVICHW